MGPEERARLLAKPHWDYHDIEAYVGCGSTKAISIKNQAIREFGGAIRYLSQCVSVDSVMRCLGTTREAEIDALSRMGVA